MRVDSGAWRGEAETRAWPRRGEVRLCEATTSELELEVEVKTEAWHRTRRGVGRKEAQARAMLRLGVAETRPSRLEARTKRGRGRGDAMRGEA